jgi:ribosomal protein L24E
MIKRLTFSYFSTQGKLYVRGDSKIFRFQNGKTESLFLQRKNPRRIAWTVLYRRQHKKGVTEVRFLTTLSMNPPYYLECQIISPITG